MATRRDLVDLFVCPSCKAEISWTVTQESSGEVLAASGSCSGGHVFEIREGIAIMLPHAAEDPWAEMVSGIERIVGEHPEIEEALFAPDPTRLGPADRFLRVQLLQARGNFDLAEREYAAAAVGIYGQQLCAALATSIDEVVARLRSGDGPIFDLASGRGMLVRAILAGTDRPVIATDVSAWVLQRLRNQVTALGLPAERLALVVCDARSLPLADGGITVLTTLEGLMNIGAAAAGETGGPSRSAELDLLREWRRVGQRMTSVQSLFSSTSLIHRAVLAHYGMAALGFPGPLRTLLRAAGWQVVDERTRTLVRRPTPRSALLGGVQIDALPLLPTRMHVGWLAATAAPDRGGGVAGDQVHL